MAIVKDFFHKIIGPSCLTREEWLTKNTVLVKESFDLAYDVLVLIADGFYIYCEKSSNNEVQRMLWSGQKTRHLVKPFVICAANGRIVDVYGPYPAKANDASIIEDILKKKTDLRNLLQVYHSYLKFCIF